MFTLHVCGGLGSSFLRYLAGIGYCLKTNILPHTFLTVQHLYDSKSGPSSSLYHNNWTIDKFLNFEDRLFRTDKYTAKAKQFNFDKTMLHLILFALSSPRLHDYLPFNSHFLDSSSQVSSNPVFWIRGLDRKADLSHFLSILPSSDFHSPPVILTNDIEYVSSNSLLSAYIESLDSFHDFSKLFSSPIIVSHLSGFSIVPFLLSPHTQTFYLFDKSCHPKKLYPHLAHDWFFFFTLLSRFCANSSSKHLCLLP